MNKLSNYILFLKEHGRPLTEINPGSDEVALQIDDALQAIELLQDVQVAILGGDILSDELGKLIYTYENWYCEKFNNETHTEYCTRSYSIARTYVNDLIKKGCKNKYVVIVI